MDMIYFLISQLCVRILNEVDLLLAIHCFVGTNQVILLIDELRLLSLNRLTLHLARDDLPRVHLSSTNKLVRYLSSGPEPFESLIASTPLLDHDIFLILGASIMDLESDLFLLCVARCPLLVTTLISLLIILVYLMEYLIVFEK